MSRRDTFFLYRSFLLSLLLALARHFTLPKYIPALITTRFRSLGWQRSED